MPERPTSPGASNGAANDTLPPLTDAQVEAYLHAHPDFLKRNPGLLAVLAPPSRNLGDVVDFQQYQVKHLQKNSESLQQRYDGLVDFCRDNLSVQAQVHEAVMRLLRTRTLESLLEVLAEDLASLFELDVVALGIELSAEEAMPREEQWMGGLVPLPPGCIVDALGAKQARLVEDTCGEVVPAFVELFIGYNELVRSCALLRLPLETFRRPALLGFGAREPDRFSPSQGTELLTFLAQVTALKLDAVLAEIVF